MAIETFNNGESNASVRAKINAGLQELESTKEIASKKDATGGYAGLTLFKINFKNALNTFTSFFANANTAIRTYTFKNRDGTIADDTDLALKANIEATATTGVALTFTEDKVYGSVATPETGNITASLVGAKLCATALLIHNSGTLPSFDSKFAKLSGSGNYDISRINYIYCQYINSTKILYSINQEL